MPFVAELNRATPGCPTSLLQFDTSNPRLENGLDQQPQDDLEMIRSLKEVAALGELIASICANDYKDIEPLIVKGPAEGPLVVLEGNRRLACIKVIKDPALAEQAGIVVPSPLRPTVLASLEKVTVYRVDTADDARAFIGFKHINGPHRWESFAKAKFVTDWFKAERGSGVTIEHIAEKLGDDNNTIRNMIAGMLVLEQAMELGFEIGDRFNRGRFAFSHLYTALTRGEYIDFLSLPKKWTADPTENPVPATKAGELREVMLWLYGSKSREKPALIKSQNPDLANLGDVFKNPVAMRMIRAGRDLKEALVELRPPTAVLAEILVEINSRLREAVQLAGRAEAVDDSLLNLSSQIEKQGRALNVLLKASEPPPSSPEAAPKLAGQ